MKRAFAFIVLVLLLPSTVFAGGIEMEAEDFFPKTLSLKQDYIDSKGDAKGGLRGIDLENYQILYVIFTNETPKPVTATVGQFSLVTSMKRSVNFTADMYSLARKPWMDIAVFPAAKVMPGTSVSGFIAFERAANDEIPEVLYFEAGDGVSAKAVVAGAGSDLSK